MKPLPLLFGGIFASFALSLVGLAVIPEWQIGHLPPHVDEDLGEIYPIDSAGQAAEGRQVYIAHGCVSCHSQQVRDEHMGADLARGWGARRTVARDYIYETPVLLGNDRTGPDLTNVGMRQTSAMWHYLHLYNPRDVMPGSIMPPYRFLFEKRKISGQRAADALDLPSLEAPPAGYEIVPKAEARTLVAYLLSLDHSHALQEAGAAKPSASPAGGAK